MRWCWRLAGVAWRGCAQSSRRRGGWRFGARVGRACALIGMVVVVMVMGLLGVGSGRRERVGRCLVRSCLGGFGCR